MRQELVDKLKEECRMRGLDLLYHPKEGDKHRRPDLFIIFAAWPHPTSSDEPLIAGAPPGWFTNPTEEEADVSLERFVDALEIVGIPRSALTSHWWAVKRGIWPTFYARLTEEAYKTLSVS